MVFKRRNRPGLWDRFRGWFYPRGGYRRSITYLGHRVKRLPDTPHRIALGFACGAFASFSPFFGLHFFYAAFVAWLVRGNVIASLIGTIVGNPLTFPAIATASYGTGLWLLGGSGSEEKMKRLWDAFGEGLSGLWQSMKSLVGIGEANWGAVGQFFTNVFLPYFLGSLIPGFIAAVIFYIVGRPIIAAYQERRRARFNITKSAASTAQSHRS